MRLPTPDVVVTEADAIGGGSRSRFWLSVMANVLDCPIHRFADGETGAAFGAARLGRLATTGETVEAVCTRPQRIETFTPDRSLAAAYAERLLGWRKLIGPDDPVQGMPIDANTGTGKP